MASSMEQRVRKRGCEAPLSREQLSATTLQLAVVALTYILLGVYAAGASIIIPISLYSATVLVVLCCWAYCVAADPSLPGGIPCARMARTQREERYCRQCRKVIPGLDHHCAWLNTCVGRRNYFFFFVLAIAGV